MLYSIIVLASVFFPAWSGDTGYEKRHEVRRTLSFKSAEGDNKIIIDNLNGSISVSGYDGNEVVAVVQQTYVAETESLLSEAQRLIRLDIREENNRIVLMMDTPWRDEDGSQCSRRDRDEYDAEFNFEVKIPYDCDVVLKTVNEGDIVVRDVRGDFTVRNVNGGIDMSGIGGSGEATTVNGPVSVRFSRTPQRDCEFKTVNGEIETEFPPSLSADLQLNTFNGEVYSDFTVSRLPPRAPTVDRKGRKRIFKRGDASAVRVGSGGPELSYDTLNGDIRILQHD